MLGLVIVILKSVIFTPDTVQQFDVKKKLKALLHGVMIIRIFHQLLISL